MTATELQTERVHVRELKPRDEIVFLGVRWTVQGVSRPIDRSTEYAVTMSHFVRNVEREPGLRVHVRAEVEATVTIWDEPKIPGIGPAEVDRITE